MLALGAIAGAQKNGWCLALLQNLKSVRGVEPSLMLRPGAAPGMVPAPRIYLRMRQKHQKRFLQ